MVERTSAPHQVNYSIPNPRSSFLNRDAIIAIICMVISNLVAIGITYYSGQENFKTFMHQVEVYQQESIRQNKINFYAKIYHHIHRLPKYEGIYISPKKHRSLQDIFDNTMSNFHALISISPENERVLINEIRQEIKKYVLELMKQEPSNHINSKSYNEIVYKIFNSEDDSVYYTESFKIISKKLELLRSLIIETSPIVEMNNNSSVTSGHNAIKM